MKMATLSTPDYGSGYLCSEAEYKAFHDGFAAGFNGGDKRNLTLDFDGRKAFSRGYADGCKERGHMLRQTGRK
jgi:hypothetical protein